jgi:hypothetical protein
MTTARSINDWLMRNGPNWADLHLVIALTVVVGGFGMVVYGSLHGWF